MVDSVQIKRVGIRDYLSIDIEVWMNNPDDMDFKPRTHLAGNRFSISSATNGREMASVELDDEQMEAAERDRQVELRVKFGVHGMHGKLTHIHPIIADGKAKKLANANWKTVQPIQFN
ncbi:MAG: hypothetical protein CMB76_00610 [Euryarchaeota archaeon]|nr:hypothetical protein [Euryarchaeota archaeon]